MIKNQKIQDRVIQFKISWNMHLSFNFNIS